MSSGAACLIDDCIQQDDLGTPSYVLSAIGVPRQLALSSVRFSFGRFTTREEVDLALDYLSQTINNIRSA